MNGSEEQVERVARAIAERSGARWENVTEAGDRGEFDWETRGYWRDLAQAAIAAMQSEGIPVYRHPDATDNIRPTCVTCGQSFDLQDPEQVAYHDSERHEPR